MLNGEIGKGEARRRASSGSTQARAWGSALVKNQNETTLDQFGILNVAEIVWEIMPYSFVLDYVWNIGGFLKAIGDQQLLDRQEYGMSFHKVTLHKLQLSRWWTSESDPILGVETVVQRIGMNQPPIPLPWRSWSETLGRFFNAFSVLSITLNKGK